MIHSPGEEKCGVRVMDPLLGLVDQECQQDGLCGTCPHSELQGKVEGGKPKACSRIKERMLGI